MGEVEQHGREGRKLSCTQKNCINNIIFIKRRLFSLTVHKVIFIFSTSPHWGLCQSPHWVLCQPRTLMIQCEREFLQRLRGLFAVCSAHGVQDAEPHRLVNESVKGFQSSGLGVFPHVCLCLNSSKFSLLCDLFSVASVGRTVNTASSSVC